MEAHHPAEDGQDIALALPLRSKTIDKGKDRRWSDNETLVASSSRWNSLHGHRSSTMQPVYESPIDDARPAATFEGRPSNMTSSRHSSPPSAGFGPPSRYATFHNGIQEAEEPDPSAVQRASTSGSHKSHWWKWQPSRISDTYLEPAPWTTQHLSEPSQQGNTFDTAQDSISAPICGSRKTWRRNLRDYVYELAFGLE